MKLLFKEGWNTKDKIKYLVVYRHKIKDKRFGNSHSKTMTYELVGYGKSVLKFTTISYLSVKDCKIDGCEVCGTKF